jgi:hypothetical protein
MSETNPPETGLSVATDDSDLSMPDGTLFQQEFWSIGRHELIAGVADERIKSKTRERINEIMQPLGNLALSDIAGWADQIKRRKPTADDDEETVNFLNDERNKHEDKWHYVDLPLGADGYDREKYPDFTEEEDVVQIINQCIASLKSKAAHTDSQRFSKINALRLLVHLVGDVHQPVHVGCCYIDESGEIPKLVKEPERVLEKQLNSDRGGNKIILDIGTKGFPLHSYWDSRLGGSSPAIGGEEGEGDDPSTPELKQRTIEKLHNMLKADDAVADEEGSAGEADATPPEEWAAQWATESLEAAHSAYQGLKITGRNANDDKSFDVSWGQGGKAAYDELCKPIVIDRMKTAARNLTLLLDTILK